MMLCALPPIAFSVSRLSADTPSLIILIIWEDVYQQEASLPYFLWHFSALFRQEPAPNGATHPPKLVCLLLHCNF